MIGLPDLEGCWRRVWLRAPGGEDRETAVFWRQGPRAFVDLRVPADLPDLRGARALAELDTAALRALTRCEGFAGVTDVTDGVCAWTRLIDYRGPQGSPDVGALEMTEAGLVERGVHAAYAELWERVEPGPVVARTLSDAQGRMLVLAIGPTGFSLGRADPEARRGAPLGAAVDQACAANDRAALAALFDREFSVGVVEDGAARITLSTDPTRVSAIAFEAADAHAATPTLVERGFDGSERAVLWA